MAKAVKKKKELTIEEKLAEALVPADEQLYKVPENWCWVSASNLALVISKGTTPRGGKAGYVDDGIRFLRVENFCEDGTLSHEGIMHISKEMHTGFLKRSILQEGDILVSIAGTLGKTAVVRSVDLPINTNQAVCFIRPKNKIVNSIFIKFAFDNPVIQNHLLSQTKVTSIPNLTLEIIGKCPVPLPPLPEQQRIVDRIESLFAKLDEAKEKAQAVMDGFEDRKAAILHKAFTGELTKEWRKERNVSISTWEQASIEKLCNVFSGKGFKEKEYSKNGVKLLRISNVTYNALTWEDTKFLPESYITEVPDLVLQSDDIVMALNRPITNGKLKVSLISDDEQYILYQRVGCLRIKDKEFVVTKYLLYFLLSRNFLHQVEQNLQGSDQPYINLPPLKKLIVNICSFQEQSSIVDILDKTLWCEQQAKEAAEQVISQIDTMKKSILARAFRGELGTNDPADESAVELLKRIL